MKRPNNKIPIIIRRDGKRCRYCGKSLKNEEITLDHVKPRCFGGTSANWNLVLACQPCNTAKGCKRLSEFLLGDRGKQFGMRLVKSIRSQHKKLQYE